MVHINNIIRTLRIDDMPSDTIGRKLLPDMRGRSNKKPVVRTKERELSDLLSDDIIEEIEVLSDLPDDMLPDANTDAMLPNDDNGDDCNDYPDDNDWGDFDEYPGYDDDDDE